MNFWDGIYGHDSEKKVLEKILFSDSIPQAIIFNGKKGIGKDFIARRFSFLLNSRKLLKKNSKIIFNNSYEDENIKYVIPLPRGKNETSGDSPLEKISKEEYKIISSEIKEKCKNPYYQIDIPKANEIKINSIRDINKFISLDVSQDSYKSVIISSAELMNDESQNALLKSLEEPPENTIFILTTSDLNRLKETIKSRCWILNFEPLDVRDLELILKNYFNFDADSILPILNFSDGSTSVALTLINSNFKLLKEKAILVLRYSLGSKFYSAFKEISFIQKENNSISTFLIFINLIIAWLNDVKKDRIGSSNFVFNDYIETIKKFNQNFSDVEVNNSILQIEKFSNLLINNNINLNIIIFNLIFELNSIITNRFNKEGI